MVYFTTFENKSLLFKWVHTHAFWQMEVLWLGMQSDYPPLQTCWMQVRIHVKTCSLFRNCNILQLYYSEQKYTFSIDLEIFLSKEPLLPRLSWSMQHTHEHRQVLLYILVDTLIQWAIIKIIIVDLRSGQEEMWNSSVGKKMRGNIIQLQN